MELRIQWSMITRIKAAAGPYHSAGAGGNTEALKVYLTALESLAEYIATRCRGSALFDEVKAAGMTEPIVPVAPSTRRRPKLVQLSPKEEPATFAAGAGDVSLAG
jgi:hypothetical protein